jgi:hypothetical protein
VFLCELGDGQSGIEALAKLGIFFVVPGPSGVFRQLIVSLFSAVEPFQRTHSNVQRANNVRAVEYTFIGQSLRGLGVETICEELNDA